MIYHNIVKHAKKITKKSINNSGKQVLQGMYMNDNLITVTDAHRLFRIKYEHGQTDRIVDPANEKVIAGEYPNVDRLISDPDNARISMKFQIDEVKQIVNILKLYKSLKVRFLSLSLTDKNTIKLKPYYDIKNVKVEYDFKTSYIFEGTAMYEMHLNADYLLECFEFLKDLSNETLIEMHLFDRNKPVLITSASRSYDYVLLPVNLRD